MPIAHDGSRCFLVVDYSPSAMGKPGQIIGLDMDVDASYLMADSLNEFFENMAQWRNNGKLFLEDMEDEGYVINDPSGHLFNHIENYAKMNEQYPPVMLPIKDDFWINRYKEDVVKKEGGECFLPSAVLEKESIAFRIMDHPEKLSCTPFPYMDRIHELIIYNSELRDFEALCKMPNLTSLFLFDCRIIGSDVSQLAELPKLRSLHIGKTGDSESIGRLSTMSSLQALSISAIDHFDCNVLGKFTNLTALEIKFPIKGDAGFLSKLTKLKDLTIRDGGLNNLDFLLSMPDLEEFEMKRPAVNEDALLRLGQLTKLKVFWYPVKNLNVYKNHPSIRVVGMASNHNREYQVFAGSHVHEFYLFASSQHTMNKEIDAVADGMKKYVKLDSYGGTSVD